MRGDEAYTGIAVVKALLPRIGISRSAAEEASGSSPETDRASAISDLDFDEELRGLLGFNVFDGLTWFNKERFVETMRMSGLFGAIANATDDPTLGIGPARRALLFIEAAAEAGYCYDELEAAVMKILPGDGKKPKAGEKTKPARKAPSSKAPSRKPNGAKK